MLPQSFLTRPIAHRAYHDLAAGRPENSIAAVQAAVEAGYGIEIDVQPARDGTAMVFHDYDLGRLTGQPGPIAQQSADALTARALLGGDGAGVPRLAELLRAVDGQVPLLIEVKDQDGAMGPNVGALEAAVAADLAGYDGAVALMSFNPHSVRALAALCPERAIGLTSCAGTATDYPTLSAARRSELAALTLAEEMALDFISHDHHDLTNPRVAALKAAGLAILCWTIRTPEEEARAREIADNVTFEGYAA